MLANMLTHAGADDALQAMAPGSLKQEASLRHEETAEEAMQRVIGAEEQEAPEQQPNHLEEAEKMQEEEEVQDTGNSGRRC